MDNSKKILFAITTFNQSNITRLCLDSLKLITDEYDVIIVDDASTDDTIRLCVEHNIKYITKETGLGLTDSWNKAYQYFKDNGYGYLIIANNDILVPDKALTEMANVLDYWPCSLVVPMSTIKGSGHNVVQAIDNYYGTNEYDNPDNYGMVQKHLFDIISRETKSNNLYKFDPIRMKHFNGFFFMMSRDICQYEREDGNLFDPKFINVKNEDEFNWANLIPNNDFPMLCKTAFVFHWKGVSFTKAGIKYNNNLKEHLEQREN
tara:strand:- start:8224 stop:9009 length:786 start_codon:yes stop_codon:yes gene_type:complete